MAMTARQLIVKSFYLSGLTSRELQTVSGDQISDGLEALNSVLSIKTANNKLIPYYHLYEFNTIAQHESYFVPNLILPQTVTFNLDTVRFSTRNVGRRNYFGAPRVDNIYSLPFSVHIERVEGGSNVYFYFIPDAAYPIKIWGKFSLDTVTLDQDLSLTMERFYIEYLRYALAEYICNDYNLSLSAPASAKLTEYENMIVDISPMDLTMSKMSTLQKQIGFNWGLVNIAKGFVPP